MAGGIGGSLTASTVLNVSHITLYRLVVVSCHKRAYDMEPVNCRYYFITPIFTAPTYAQPKSWCGHVRYRANGQNRRKFSRRRILRIPLAAAVRWLRINVG